MPLDHFVLMVPSTQFEECVRWYEKVLEPLDYKKMAEYPGHAVGFGDFWVGAAHGKSTEIGQHFAFKTQDRASVRKFYEAAIEAGGKDNGKPGIREMYGPHYYGAFVFDPAGNNVEAVCKLDVQD